MYKCKSNGLEFLLYSTSVTIDFNDFPPDIEIEGNVDPSHYPNLAIIKYENFVLKAFGLSKRSIDRILSEEGIETYNDLVHEYFLIQTKQSNKSKRIRDFVVEKYIEVIDYVSIE